MFKLSDRNAHAHVTTAEWQASSQATGATRSSEAGHGHHTPAYSV
ncbi:hypothetical protein [Salinisphaera sp. T5B8]